MYSNYKIRNYILHNQCLNQLINQAPMPIEYRIDRYYQPRGVSNRMAALDWIRRNGIKSGVLYFADDDNTYDIRIFEEVYIL